MNEEQKDEVYKMAMTFAGGTLGVLVIMNLILNIFGRLYL